MRKASINYESVDKGYLEDRALAKGAAGWVLLAGLGVSFVISGDFAAWSALFYFVLIAYFGLYSRHHLVAAAPEEEFAAIARAEAEIK